MISRVLAPTNVSYLDDLFDYPNIKPVPAATLAKIPQNDISLWCWKRGLYQVPTIELIDFLKAEIGEPASCIEIGAGAGHIGRQLGIRMTDNMMQDWPEIKLHYKAANQPTVNYGRDVENIPAKRAINKHLPKTVLACWVTEKWVNGRKDGSMHGVDEELMLSRPPVEKYILVGNQLTHGGKAILKTIPYQVLQFDWLYSRSMEKSQNAIWTFKP